MRRIDRGRYTRTLPEILAIVQPLRLFDAGEPSFHRPFGAILRDCDFLYLPLTKLLRDESCRNATDLKSSRNRFAPAYLDGELSTPSS